MKMQNGNTGFYQNANYHLHPYLVKEKEVSSECEIEKEKLKSELIAAAKQLASEKTYSFIDAKMIATELIDERFDKIVDRMKESTTDVERRQVIENRWQIISGELYSPLRFKKILESILKGESAF